VRHLIKASARETPCEAGQLTTMWRYIMAKRGRKKRDRKHSKANHGNRPNA
jgi:hypothetical protein